MWGRKTIKRYPVATLPIMLFICYMYCYSSFSLSLPWQPEFSVEPLTSDEAVNSWLRFYEVCAPLTCLSEFISHDPVREGGREGGREGERTYEVTCFYPLPLSPFN